MSRHSAVRTPAGTAWIAISLMALAIVGGCDQSITEPVPATVELAPSFGITNAPATSGIVMRDGLTVALSWVDPNTGLRLLIGGDVVALCEGNPNFQVAPLQYADLGDDRIVTLIQGEDLPTSVWGFLPFDCDRYLTEDPAAAGFADLIWTDNDFDGDRLNRINTNVWTLTASGTLSTPSGDAARLSAHQTALYPEPLGPVYVLNSVVRLTR